jgi:hypothetical protein
VNEGAEVVQAASSGDGSGADSDGPGADSHEAARPVTATGVLRVGRMTAIRDTFHVYENADLRDLLPRNFPADTVIEADEGAHFSIVDADVHHWPTPPTVGELEAYLAAVVPTPDAAWISHGRGMKLVFVGRSHRDRALAAAFTIPSSFTVEVLPHTRHPGSSSSSHDGNSCGPVTFFENAINAPFTFQAVSRLTAELRQQALDVLGLHDGGRFDHDRCPIDQEAESDSRNCIVVLDHGVYCHRCAGHDVHYRDQPTPGFVPFAAVVGSAVTQLDVLARELVHWTHARIELKHAYRNLAEPLLREVYTKVLQSIWSTDDPRIKLVFNRDLDIAWGAGQWLAAANLEPTKFDDDLASGFPYCLRRIGNNKKPNVQVDRVRRTQAKHRTPRGYTPVRPVRGISFIQGQNSIPVTAPPLPKHPIRLLDDPLPEAEAFQRLERPFPLLHRPYLKASLAAAICAEGGGGQPPMITCSGPSGSAKEQTVRLAASFMGQQICKVPLTEDEERFARRVGADISAGYRFLVFDELSKTNDLTGKMKLLLMLSASIQWRPLYRNQSVSTQVRAAFFFPCVRFPDFLRKNQEFVRRTRHMHLWRQVPNWARTSHGDTAEWRDRAEENALIANSILTHVWRDCHERSFRFF